MCDFQCNWCGWLPLTLNHVFIFLCSVTYMHITLSTREPPNAIQICCDFLTCRPDAIPLNCPAWKLENHNVRVWHIRARHWHATSSLWLVGRQSQVHSGTCPEWVKDEYLLKFAVFCDLMPHSLAEACQHFSGTASHHLLPSSWRQ